MNKLKWLTEEEINNLLSYKVVQIVDIKEKKEKAGYLIGGPFGQEPYVTHTYYLCLLEKV